MSIEPNASPGRVDCGGSWGDLTANARVACRDALYAGTRYCLLAFRLIRRCM